MISDISLRKRIDGKRRWRWTYGSLGELLNTLKERGWIPDLEIKPMLRNGPNEIDIPRLFSNRYWLKAIERGEKRKEDRKFGVRGCGRGMGKHKNTDVFKRKTISFINNNNFCFHLQNVLLIGKRESEIKMKSYLKWLYGRLLILSWTVSCLLIIPTLVRLWDVE